MSKMSLHFVWGHHSEKQTVASRWSLAEYNTLLSINNEGNVASKFPQEL